MYCCERSRQDNCIREKSNIISVKKETLEETQRTVYVLAGTSFKQECSGNFSSFKWVFEANNPTTAGKTLRPESVTVTSNKTIHIPNVTIPDAGKYTCLVNPCGRSSLKLLTIHLCVIKVSVNPGDGFAVSCAVVCNEEFSQKSRVSSQMMNTSGVSVHVDGSGKLTCNASQIFTSDERSTVTSSHASTTTTFRKTTEGSTQNEDWSGLVCGVLVPPACLVLILMFCLRSRLQSAFPFPRTCCVFSRVTSVEDESNVVYSSVAFRTSAKARSNITHNECIYSEVKYTRKCST
ncbi:hypothetical protein FQA47_025405 [Oryzias melastigma]|uniref:Ig-like domain-containing protein n=1 Tax=Oryzias melastigma TaxID=30732 RepID=A0A834BQU1_ORYME|nr:hypothetical protein FQA47_025405 [Oryzias melastigma]